MTHPYLQALRDLAASFPETEEKETWDHPTFRAGPSEKIFASAGTRDDRPTIGVKSTKARQAVLLEEADCFFFPAYVGQHGWVGIFCDTCEWERVAELVEASYRLVALKRMIKALDASRDD